jgi:hypothetical protein
MSGATLAIVRSARRKSCSSARLRWPIVQQRERTLGRPRRIACGLEPALVLVISMTDLLIVFFITASFAGALGFARLCDAI